ncbi:Hypothetical protein FKW44_007345 [Caligus rogercresseyi]|uniref:Uncharacterized protein n=1 Tax=Caligus rogercresseyi TaxID=217165 RepID=A0A7T8KEL4_CALRO|nr:Hypothetical protein FKW44_007345 [Caligus rogercresseyi]
MIQQREKILLVSFWMWRSDKPACPVSNSVVRQSCGTVTDAGLLWRDDADIQDPGE